MREAHVRDREQGIAGLHRFDADFSSGDESMTGDNFFDDVHWPQRVRGPTVREGNLRYRALANPRASDTYAFPNGGPPLYWRLSKHAGHASLVVIQQPTLLNRDSGT